MNSLILLADGLKARRGLVRAALRPILVQGARCVEVGDGLDALVALRKLKPRVLIARRVLDGLDGDALFRLARTEADLRGIHLIGVCGAASPATPSPGLGPHDWVRDPFDPSRLRDRVAEVLRLAPGFLGSLAD